MSRDDRPSVRAAADARDLRGRRLPDVGAVMRALGVAWQVSAVAWLLWVLQATIRGWWIQDRRDKAYTAHKFDPQLKGGESDDDQRLGLVRGRSLAGGQGSSTGSPCRYCGVVDGHTAQCPVVSFGVN